jgi:hypothetical protein
VTVVRADPTRIRKIRLEPIGAEAASSPTSDATHSAANPENHD